MTDRRHSCGISFFFVRFFFLIFGDFAACHHCHPPLHMSAPWSLALTLHRAHHLHPTGLCRLVVGQKLQKRVTDAKRQNNIIQHYPNGNGNWHLCYTLFQVRLRHHWLPHITLRPQPAFTCTRNGSTTRRLAGRPADREEWLRFQCHFNLLIWLKYPFTSNVAHSHINSLWFIARLMPTFDFSQSRSSGWRREMYGKMWSFIYFTPL